MRRDVSVLRAITAGDAQELLDRWRGQAWADGFAYGLLAGSILASFIWAVLR